MERTLKREVKEEAGIEIENIRYVTSLADAREDDDPSLVISCLADWAGGEVALEEGMTEYQWATPEESQKVDLIEGIYDELIMADTMARGEGHGEWRKTG